MFSLFGWLVSWVLNGISFVAVVGYLAYAYGLNYVSVPVGDEDPFKAQKAQLEDRDDKRMEEERERNLNQAHSGLGPATKPLSGWLTMRRQFKPGAAGAQPAFATAPSESTPIIGTPVGTESSEEGTEASKEMDRSDSASTNTQATYSSRLAQTYRSMVEARAKSQTPPKEFYYCILKGRVLFVYEDESASNCLAALDVSNHVVRVEREDGRRFKGKDAEMFAKRNAIVLRAKKGKEGLPVVSKGMQADQGVEGDLESKQIFLFSRSNTLMEDWYIALLQASSQAPTFEKVFDPSDMRALVDTIDTEPDPIPMRWFNAMLGRVFFALYKTEALEQFIIGKIMKKLTRVNRPGFLGPIVVREVNVGNTAPFFSKPMLKNLTADGEASFEAHMRYDAQTTKPDSQLRITIATTATIPTGFKPYVVDLVLAVVVKSIEGNMTMQIKRPPSNRFWYGFTHMPKMEIDIIPVVSERKIQIGMVLNQIEKQLREVIQESVVAPNMDDIAFFDTSKLQVRGGIFSEAGKIPRNLKGEQEESPEEPNPNPDIETSNEDPNSAVPATTSLRKRNTHKSSTLDVAGPDHRSASEDSSLAIPRTETAPAAIGAGTSTKKAAAIQATKRWFAQTGTSRPPSLSAQTVTGHVPSSSDTALAQARSRSSERAVIAEEPRPVESNFGNEPEVAAVRVSSSTAGLVENDQHALASRKSSDSDATAATGGIIHIHALAADPKANESATSSSSTLATSASFGHPGAEAQHSSTASLLTSLRSRDKKAIQAQAATARESLKKWGVGFAAKRRAGSHAAQEHEEHRPAALYRPPDEDAREDESLALPTSPGRSLQDRLNAAAHAGATPLPIPSRERSASASSRPSLFTSPGKSTALPASTSPPRWAPSTSKPTTSVVNDISPASASTNSHARRASNPAPVLMQPAPGKSMVVPRVPKRPGQVTGIGHSANDPMVRKVSAEEGLKDERVEDVSSKAPPALPPRTSKETLRRENGSQAISADGNRPQPGDTPSPARQASPRPGDVVPPPLPARKISPTPSNSNMTASKPTPTPPAAAGALQRSDSAPSGITDGATDTARSTPQLPEINVPPLFESASDVRGQADESGNARTPLSASTAENALRQVVARNEEIIKAKGGGRQSDVHVESSQDRDEGEGQRVTDSVSAPGREGEDRTPSHGDRYDTDTPGNTRDRGEITLG